MTTVTKKELIDRIADRSGAKRVQVKRVVQQFLQLKLLQSTGPCSASGRTFKDLRQICPEFPGITSDNPRVFFKIEEKTLA